MAGVGLMEADARDALGGRWGAGGAHVAGRGGSPRLVGAVAQGAEEREIRPLTTMLGESMRRRCVLGSEAAWGALRRTEAGLTGDVDAFEGRKVGMGVMEAD